MEEHKSKANGLMAHRRWEPVRLDLRNYKQLRRHGRRPHWLGKTRLRLDGNGATWQ